MLWCVEDKISIRSSSFNSLPFMCWWLWPFESTCPNSPLVLIVYTLSSLAVSFRVQRPTNKYTFVFIWICTKIGSFYYTLDEISDRLYVWDRLGLLRLFVEKIVNEREDGKYVWTKERKTDQSLTKRREMSPNTITSEANPTTKICLLTGSAVCGK
jgi:lipopolysaccharide export LptBFGC system permease protein LptF